jgi:alkylation response protein AidB-like acyl-CoA dehydrogenase
LRLHGDDEIDTIFPDAQDGRRVELDEVSKGETEDQEFRKYRLKARSWLADNVRRRSEIDVKAFVDERSERLQEFKALQQKLFDAGYAGITFPVEYGGQGLTLEHERVFNEEASGYDMPPTNFGVSVHIIGATLIEFGTHEQNLRHIPNILAGKELWLQLLSEPSGGSDLAGLLTSAIREGDSFVVNGQKTWSSNPHLSDYALCPVRTRWDLPKHQGISVLIVDLKTPGIEIRRIKQIDAGAEFGEEFFTDVVVPASNLLGDENDGWRVTRGLLEIEHAWVGRGGVSASFDEEANALTTLVKRKGLHHDPGVRRQVVAMHVVSTVQKLVSARISDAMASGSLSHAYGGLLKLGDDIVIQRRAELALALAGSAGVAWSGEDEDAGHWSRQVLNTRRVSIAGGTDEIQRNNVSERALGLPREPTSDRDVPFNQVPHN